MRQLTNQLGDEVSNTILSRLRTRKYFLTFKNKIKIHTHQYENGLVNECPWSTLQAFLLKKLFFKKSKNFNFQCNKCTNFHKSLPIWVIKECPRE